jgi:WD40 repeat protein
MVNLQGAGKLRLWDVATGQELPAVKGQTAGNQSLAFSPDGKFIATGVRDGTVCLWDWTREEAVTIKGTDGWVAFSPDSKHVASARVGGFPDAIKGAGKIWDAVTGKEVAVFPALNYTSSFVGPVCVTFSHDGKCLVGPGAGAIKFWDIATGKSVLTLPQNGRIIPLAVSPDGKYLASSTRTTKTGEKSPPDLGGKTLPGSGGFPKPKKPMEGPIGVQYQRHVTLWDLTTGKKKWKVTGHPESFASVAFSPNSKLLASGSVMPYSGGGSGETPAKVKAWGEIKLWDVGTGKELLHLKGHASNVKSVAFSPDGKLLASASQNSTKLWDVASGKAILSFKGHLNSVNCVSFHPDGKRLASASQDGTVRLWDVASGQEVLVLKVPSIAVYSTAYSGVTGVAFSPDGKRLACASNAAIMIWDGSKSMKEVTQK